jgi:ferric-dicitrate binding protein FerR (iron transport regulator)
MNNDSQNKQKLLQAYLQGILSENEESELTDWINSSDQNFQSFKKYIAENQFSQTHTDETNEAWQRIREKLKYRSKQSCNRKIILPNWLKVAALIAIALISGIFINRVSHNKPKDQVWNKIIVPKGEKAQLILSDGSTVFLNSNTQLKYPSIFSENYRKISLSGEAFFNIKKKSSNPFIVETPEFNVTVTGTSFNLLAYNEDKENSVTLHTGSVTIARNGHNYRISPGEKYILNNETKKSNIIRIDLEKSSLWKEGIIIIDNLDLKEIQKLLERKFNVQIKITDDKLKNIRYTGQFKPHENLEEIRDTSPVKFKYRINKTKDLIIIE